MPIFNCMSPKHKALLAVSVALVLGIADVGAALIYGSGEGPNPSPAGARDSNWYVVALPSSFSPPDGQTIPYQAYVLGLIPWNWGYAGERQFAISGAWNNAAQAGFTYDGGTAYWIAASPSGSSLFPGVGTSWIARQTFTVTTAGDYTFNFLGAADDSMRFFINGSIDTTDSLNPTITGGTQIGSTVSTYASAQQLTGSVYLGAGTHSAYMVLYDVSGFTGALIGRSSFESAAVPEPGTWAAAALLVGGAFSMRWRKRAKVS